MKSFVLKFVCTFALLTFFALPTFAQDNSQLLPCSSDKTTGNAPVKNADQQKDGLSVSWCNTCSL